MLPKDDILAQLDFEENTASQDVFQNFDSQSEILPITQEDIYNNTSIIHEVSEILPENHISEEIIKEKTPFMKAFWWIIFLIKYFSTSIWIFWVLLVVSNYSAYWNLASSIIYADDLERTKNSLIESVAASSITENTSTSNSEVNTFKQLWVAEDEIPENTNGIHDMTKFVNKSKTSNIDLGIEITPYENRIVIPKIGKNIPLLDITQTTVEGKNELNDIFMKELENGVIRYPGSAKPGEDGNSFIFGHSSNFPWIDGDFNDVFALLDKVVFDDEIVVYYGQEKYIYKVRSKNVIRPGDVSVLKSNEKSGKKELTLMTCWPIGTTLNRLVLTADLIEIQK